MNANAIQDVLEVPEAVRKPWLGETQSKAAGACGHVYAGWVDAMEHVALDTLQTRARLASAQIDCLASMSALGDATDLSVPMHTLARNWFALRSNLWRNWFSLLRSAPSVQWSAGHAPVEAEAVPVAEIEAGQKSGSRVKRAA